MWWILLGLVGLMVGLAVIESEVDSKLNGLRSEISELESEVADLRWRLDEIAGSGSRYDYLDETWDDADDF